jgi:hypothetical protein
MALVKYNNNSISAVTSAASIPSGAMTHIKTLTASSSSTLSFVDGSSSVVLDSTYPIYVFKFINIHPANNDIGLYFNLSTDGGSNYNVTKTSTNFYAYHYESDSSTGLTYYTGGDLAQSTGNQLLTGGTGNDNDQAISGELTIYNPSSTTFVKHFMANISSTEADDRENNYYIAGYGNTQSPINAVRFLFGSGNIDAGTIKLYGIKDS